MKQVIISIILTLTMLLTSCSSCNPFARKDPDPDGSTIVDLESSDTGESSKTAQNDPGKPGQDSSKDDSYKGGGRVGGGQGSGSVDGSGNDSSKKDESSKNDSKTESSKPEDSKSESSKPEESSKTESSSVPESSAAPEISENEKAAARAKELLKEAWYDRTEMISTLEGEGFSSSAAVYGADHCDADWKKQAARAANWYADGAIVTPKDVRMFLESTNFTTDEIDYGMANNSIDWAAKCKAFAKQVIVGYTGYSYITLGNTIFTYGFDSADITTAIDAITDSEWKQEATEYADMVFTSQTFMGLVEEIKFGGFSEEQAIYGAENFGIDWYSAALIDADNYLVSVKTSAINVKDYLKNTLEYSDAQAQYAVDNIDFKQVAKELADMMNTSYSELYDLLYYYGFTVDEINYALAEQDFTQKARNRAQDYVGCDYFEIAEYLYNDGFSESDCHVGAGSTGAYISDDDCYQDAMIYYAINPGCTMDEMITYITGLGKYNSTRAYLVANTILNAKG